jgi:succinylarginine dihydrolase
VTRATEINFDGIVGPTHNYAGLSHGNLASMSNQRAISNPRDAALQGLAKMKFMADLGLAQSVLPPHERPHIPTLRRLGFTGSDGAVLDAASRDPLLLASVSSASAMWAANAATVSPSADTYDGRVHFTPANLVSNFHRSIETATTARVLCAIFCDPNHFAHHQPLPPTPLLSDEGAANYMRLDEIEIFTAAPDRPTRFPARQSIHASEAVARLHGVRNPRLFHQHPIAIDAGAFHNDVVAVANENVLLYHQLAWVESNGRVAALLAQVADAQLIEVSDDDVPLADAISSYLFNSQLVTLPDASMALVAPSESAENPRAKAFLDRLLAMNTRIRHIHFVDVRQSMRNGGGPACLRLRILLNDAERAVINPHVMFSNALHQTLVDWVNRHYRDRLAPDDLRDPHLLDESRRALDELSQILHLPNIHDFQRV